MLTDFNPVELVHRISIPIGGKSICNLRFADDIDLMGGSNDELRDLTNRLSDRATAYGPTTRTTSVQN